MTPPLPKSIRVGPIRYRVSCDAESFKKAKKIFEKTNDGFLHGWTDHADCTITINPDMGLSLKQETLMHEVLHCVVRHNDWSVETGMEEEQIVRRISPVMLSTLQLNPELVTYLLYEEINQ